MIMTGSLGGGSTARAGPFPQEPADRGIENALLGAHVEDGPKRAGGQSKQPVIHRRAAPRHWYGLIVLSGSTLVLTVAEPVQEKRERLDVVVEAQFAHGPDDILGGDGLALLAMAAFVGLPSDKADVLGDTLLDGLFCIVGDFGVRREDATHNAYHVGYRHVLVLLADNAWCSGRR